MINTSAYHNLMKELSSHHARLLIVTKNQTIEDVQAFYNLGHRLFGENKVQKLVEKKEALPTDIEWHLIGPLQKNKIKYICTWIRCVQSIDSWELAKALNQQALQSNKIIDIYLEVKIAMEETKYGFSIEALDSSLQRNDWNVLKNLSLKGMMGMASFTDDQKRIHNEFDTLHSYFVTAKQQYACLQHMDTLSMGMSGDYRIALNHGSNMVRIGSLLFSQ